MGTSDVSGPVDHGGDGPPAGRIRNLVSEIAASPALRIARPCDEPRDAAVGRAQDAAMLTRRQFAQAAGAAGAVLAFGIGKAAAPPWRERRDLYPQGVASGDPAPDSVLLWTRRQPGEGEQRDHYLLTV